MDLKENRCVLSFFPAVDMSCSCVPGAAVGAVAVARLLNLLLEGR